MWLNYRDVGEINNLAARRDRMSKEQHATANVPIHEILLHDFLRRYTTTIVSPILKYSAQDTTTTLLRTRDPTGQRLKHL